MKQDIASLWTETLRSGTIQQCTGTLNNGVGMCCLGVLSELASEVGVTSKHHTDVGFSADYEYGYYVGNEGSTVLGRDVLDWSGMSTEAGEIMFFIGTYGTRGIFPDKPDYLRMSLAEMNDGGLTFSQIADVIDHSGEDL